MISKYMKIQKKTKRRKSEIKVRGGTYSQYCCICVPTCRTSISKSFGTLKGSCSQLVYSPPPPPTPYCVQTLYWQEKVFFA